MLHEQIKADIITSMKERAALRLETLRGLITAINNHIIETSQEKEVIVTDEEVVTIVRRLVKQRKESAIQYRAVGSEENAVKEDEEQTILIAYLPPEMSKEEVHKIVVRIKGELGVSDNKGRGQLMKACMEELKGKVGGGVVADIIDSVLN